MVTQTINLKEKIRANLILVQDPI